MKNSRTSVIALAIASGTAAIPAAAGLIDITKNETIAVPAGMFLTARGQGKVFATADSNATQVFDNPASTFFSLSGTADSLPTIKADAQLGDYRGIATARAGIATGAGAVVNVPVVLGARAQWPDTPPPNGGFAVAISIVKLRGTVTVNSVTVNKVTITGATEIPKIINSARDKGAVVLDPIHLFAQDTVTGETIDSDVYSNEYIAEAGGAVGFNGSGLLELSVPDSPDPDTIAEFDSSTLVPYANDLSGVARLENGILTATGIFDPDPSHPITDFWALTFSPTDPTYIDDAVFLNSSQFGELDITPVFTDPATGADDPVTMELDLSLTAQESSIPEPDAQALLAIGLLGLLGFSKRPRRQGKAGIPHSRE